MDVTSGQTLVNGVFISSAVVPQPYTFVVCKVPFLGLALMPLLSLTAPQLPGEFRERDFVFMSKEYVHHCLICDHTETGWYPLKTYICRDCRRKRNRANERARNGTSEVKKRHIKLYGKICSKCGGEFEQLILHHITPVAFGGKTNMKNTMLVCDGCHRELHSSEKLQWQGYRILQDAS